MHRAAILAIAPSSRLPAVNSMAVFARVGMVWNRSTSDAFGDLLREVYKTFGSVKSAHAHLAQRGYRTYRSGSPTQLLARWRQVNEFKALCLS